MDELPCSSVDTSQDIRIDGVDYHWLTNDIKWRVGNLARIAQNDTIAIARVIIISACTEDGHLFDGTIISNSVPGT